MNYRALGHCFSIEADSPELQAAVDELFGSLRSDVPARARYRICGQGQRVWVACDDAAVSEQGKLSEALDAFVADLNFRAVASRPRHLVLHAAAGAHGSFGVILPGPSGSGKSTLAAELSRAGFGYLSDEVAAIDPLSLEIEPYPKPLSLHDGSGAPRLVPAESLAGPVPVEAVVFPSYEAGSPASLEEISRAEALIELANNSFNFLASPHELLPVLQRLVLSSWCGRLQMGDRTAACALLAELADRRLKCPTS